MTTTTMVVVIRRQLFISCCLLSLAFNMTAIATAAVGETNELQQLRSQIDALIVQRRDDYSKLEAIARNSQNKDAEIDQLRNEIRDIKMELDSVKAKSSPEGCSDGSVGDANGGGGGNRMKNEQLTVEWLSNSISEIRSEIAELAKSFNSTVALQQRQSLSTDISILQNDVVSLRHDVEHLKTNAAKYDAKLVAFAQDVEALKQSTSSVAAKVVNFTQQIRIFSAYDWSEVVKPLKKTQHLEIFKKMVVSNENPLKMQVFTTTRRRRRRRRRSHRRDYGRKRNDDDDDDDDDDNNNNNNNYYDDDDAAREQNGNDDKSGTNADAVVQLEKRVKKLEKLVRDATCRNKAQEKLHSSMLELLESVENIEAKFDNVTPVLKREISKMEFSLAQIIANLSLTRQHQDNDKIFLSTVAENLSKAQSKLADFEHRLNVSDGKLGRVAASFNSCTSFMLQNVAQQSFNYMLDTAAATDAATDADADDSDAASTNGGEGDSDLSSSPLSSLLQLFSISNLYADFLRRLPKDCNQVDGGSDLYVMSVDDASPIVVFCEKRTAVDTSAGAAVEEDAATSAAVTSSSSNAAYIVIQRRTTGQMDFNRNWLEYARGFGNLRGEFWLGNEIIHRLTNGNDTALRMEFQDARGQRWYAEYDTFSVASRHQAYKVHANGFSGNATDAFQHHNGMPFSTKDADHDTSADTNCAAKYESGWWFSRCQQTNLNAKYNAGLTWFDYGNNEWIAVSSTKMMLIKRKLASAER